MDDRDVYHQVSALLDDDLQPLGMLQDRGPRRALRELTRGIVFTASVQLSNAARLLARHRRQRHRAVERLSGHLADPRWDHREWAAAVLQLQAEAIEDHDLIPIDTTELAKPYARCMEYQCIVRDASRVGDPLVEGHWCFGAYHGRPDLRLASIDTKRGTADSDALRHTPGGVEHLADSPTKAQVRRAGGAESGALGGDSVPAAGPADPEVQAVVGAWPSLPAAVREAILHVVRAAGRPS